MSDRAASSPIDSGLVEEIQAIRDALGILALREPTACRLYLGADGDWRMRCDGACERSFDTRDMALTAAKLAVARCRSYCLCLQGEDGRVVRSQSNWPAPLKPV